MLQRGALYVAVLLVLGACDKPEPAIQKLIVIAGTTDGRILEVDAASGAVRGVNLGLPPVECGATADPSRREIFVARRSHQTTVSLYRIDVDGGRILEERRYDDLARAAGLESAEPAGDCPLAVSEGHLYMPLARTGDAYAIGVINARSLGLLSVLSSVPVVPFAMAVTRPLPYAPAGALVVEGLEVDQTGQPILGSLRIVGYDLRTEKPLPELDLRLDAPYGAGALAASADAASAYFAAFPSLLRLNLVDGNVGPATATPAAGPVALARGLVFQAAMGVTVEQPGPGNIYVFDPSPMLIDSINVWPPGEHAPPFVNQLATDAAGDRLYLYAGTGEGGLYYDLQRARLLIVDLDQQALVGQIPLGIWVAGSMLVMY